tara:strand:- start:86 stop:211 length:126 start_codon:yes stop_codon:yes gene_type:complete
VLIFKAIEIGVLAEELISLNFDVFEHEKNIIVRQNKGSFKI